MKIHYIDTQNKKLEEVIIPFGRGLLPVVANVRPAYIIVDKDEFITTYMTEKQIILYFQRLQRALIPGGKIYLEVADYGL